MKAVVSHPTGNRNVRAILDSFLEQGILAEFCTTIAVNQTASFLSLVPPAIKKEFIRRHYPLPSQLIWTRPWRELCRMVLPKLGFRKIVKHEIGWASVDAVYQDLDRAVARRLNALQKQNINLVYAYEDGALEMFRKAKTLGIACAYDLPIAYWEILQQLLREEAERLPAWKKTLGGGVLDSVQKLERKTDELRLADAVIVPGQFVARSLPAWAKEKSIIVSPFGSPSINISKPIKKAPDANQPLRILFVGSMGQRKGLGDLFEAMKQISSRQVELVVMGSLLEDLSFYQKQGIRFTYEPGRPHAEVLALMRSCDVFCLPSIVEGRALVMQEAMSQGLPLIITSNTGGEDLVIEGKTGFLVPIRNANAIAEKIDWFANSRDLIPEMGEAARLHAATYRWKEYGDHVVHSLLSLFQKP